MTRKFSWSAQRPTSRRQVRRPNLHFFWKSQESFREWQCAFPRERRCCLSVRCQCPLTVNVWELVALLEIGILIRIPHFYIGCFAMYGKTVIPFFFFPVTEFGYLFKAKLRNGIYSTTPQARVKYMLTGGGDRVNGRPWRQREKSDVEVNRTRNTSARLAAH